jgi:hypothetical protein
MTIIEHCFKLRYTPKDNEITLSVNEGKSLFGSVVLDLNDYKPNQVYKHWVDVIKDKDNDNDLEFEIGVLCETLDRDKENFDKVFTNSLKRKLPDRIDILNEDSESIFIDKMKTKLIDQIEFEKKILAEYYSEDEIKTMINQKYNYIVSQNLTKNDKIDLDDLLLFNDRVLFPRWEDDMKIIYDEFTTTTSRALDNRTGDLDNLLDKAAVMLLTRTLGRRNNKLFGMDYQDRDSDFNIRNFVTTLILMSSLTVGQKLDLLYEIYDWEDGEGDGLDTRAIKLMISTILNRNLQYISSNQTNNIVELLFDGDATSISS